MRAKNGLKRCVCVCVRVCRDMGGGEVVGLERTNRRAAASPKTLPHMGQGTDARRLRAREAEEGFGEGGDGGVGGGGASELRI